MLPLLENLPLSLHAYSPLPSKFYPLYHVSLTVLFGKPAERFLTFLSIRGVVPPIQSKLNQIEFLYILIFKITHYFPIFLCNKC